MTALLSIVDRFDAPRSTTTVVSGVHPTTGALRSVPVDARAAAAFEAALESVSNEVSLWTDADLLVVRAELELWDTEAATGTLAALATHGTVEAFEMIAELRMELPPELKDVAELAFAMALGALGFDYVREEDDTAPQVRAAA